MNLIATLQVWGLQLKRFLSDKKGQGLVEYALIIALIAVAVIVALQALSGQIVAAFQNIAAQL